MMKFTIFILQLFFVFNLAAQTKPVKCCVTNGGPDTYESPLETKKRELLELQLNMADLLNKLGPLVKSCSPNKDDPRSIDGLDFMGAYLVLSGFATRLPDRTQPPRECCGQKTEEEIFFECLFGGSEVQLLLDLIANNTYLDYMFVPYSPELMINVREFYKKQIKKAP